MTDEQMQELASLYALGSLDPIAREDVERKAATSPVFAKMLADLSGIATNLSVAYAAPAPTPPEARDQIFASVAARMPSAVTKAFGLLPEDGADVPIVVTGTDIVVRWVSPAFSGMCGHSLQELRGHRLGPILQGRDTDPRAVATMREAIRARVPVTQDVVNYHKDGSAYLVSVSIQPVFGADSQPICFVARERKLDA